MSSLNCGLQFHGGEIVKRREREREIGFCFGVCDSVVWDWGGIEIRVYIYIYI